MQMNYQLKITENNISEIVKGFSDKLFVNTFLIHSLVRLVLAIGQDTLIDAPDINKSQPNGLNSNHLLEHVEDLLQLVQALAIVSRAASGFVLENADLLTVIF